MPRSILSMCLFALIPSLAVAQGRSGGITVDGSVLAARELHSHTVGVVPGEVDDDLSGTTAGFGGGIGMSLSPRTTARLEVAVPTGSATSTFSVSSGTSPFVVTTTRNEEARSWTSSALVGYRAHQRGRLAVSVLGGVAFIRETSDVAIETTSPGAAPILPPMVQRSELTLVSYRAGVALGLDVEARLSDRFALVPQLRVVAFSGRIGLRPGVALRWTP